MAHALFSCCFICCFFSLSFDFYLLLSENLSTLLLLLHMVCTLVRLNMLQQNQIASNIWDQVVRLYKEVSMKVNLLFFGHSYTNTIFINSLFMFYNKQEKHIWVFQLYQVLNIHISALDFLKRKWNRITSVLISDCSVNKCNSF